MKKIFLILVTLILFYGRAFASREEIIEQTLDVLETHYAAKNNVVSTVTAPEIIVASPNNRETSFYVSGGYNANHMHYKELSGQETLDEDYGKLEGFYLAGGSSLGPLSFKERAEVHRYGLKLGAYTTFAQKGEFSGYLDSRFI